MSYPTFEAVPYWTARRPSLWAALLAAARQRVVRCVLFGDSRCTPGAQGVVYPPQLNTLAAQTYGFAESVISRPVAYGVDGFGTDAHNGDWCMNGTYGNGTGSGGLSSGQVPYSLGARSHTNSGYGDIRVLDYNGAGLSQPVNAAANFPALDLADLASQTVKAEVLGVTASGSGEFAWQAMPTAGARPTYFDTVAASGTTSMGLDSATPAVKSALLTLPYAGGKPYQQVILNGASASPANLLGVRFRSAAASPAGLVFQPIAAGGKQFSDFATDAGGWGLVLQALGFDFAAFFLGVNDALNNLTGDQVLAQVQAAIAAVRAATGQPALPVLLLGNNPIASTAGSTGELAVYDQLDGVFSAIAGRDPLVLAINSRRLLEESGHTTATAGADTSDGIHPTAALAIAKAAVEWGVLQSLPAAAASPPASLDFGFSDSSLAPPIRSSSVPSDATAVTATLYAPDGTTLLATLALTPSGGLWSGSVALGSAPPDSLLPYLCTVTAATPRGAVTLIGPLAVYGYAAGGVWYDSAAYLAGLQLLTANLDARVSTRQSSGDPVTLPAAPAGYGAVVRTESVVQRSETVQQT